MMMMKIVSISHLFAVSFFSALSFNFHHPNPFSGVDALGFRNTDVVCLPESPEVCIGNFYITSPNPSRDNYGVTIYVGGWSFEYTFVEGLEAGTYDDDVTENAKTGLSVAVTIESDNSACEIVVAGTETTSTCTMCSAANCENSFSNNGIMYDCTNLENGTASTSDCESLEPIFYPFVLDGTSTSDSSSAAAADGASKKDNTESSSDQKRTEVVLTTSSANNNNNNMTTMIFSSVFVLGLFGTTLASSLIF